MKVLLAIALAVLPGVAVAETVDQVAARYALAGEVLVAKGDKVVVDTGYGWVEPGGKARHKAGARWRLASITKQVTATLLVRNFGTTLDEPMASRLDFKKLAGFDKLTLRQLLTHHSGLPNPDETSPNSEGVPAFYTKADPSFSYCFGKPPKPGSDFSYNNCDYLMAGSLLEFSSGKPLSQKWPRGMTMARAGQVGVPGFISGKPEPHYELASFGAAGGLIGSARAVFRFDRALMTGKLLPPAARAELWKPEGGRSYQALGQWVFPGQLKGCAKPKRIVQRDGEIGGVQTRNYILPDDDLVVIVFTNRGSDDFAIGEVWQGKGFAYDLLSAAACP